MAKKLKHQLSRRVRYIKDASFGKGLLLEKIDLSYLENSASFLQSAFWGNFKSRFGWEALSYKFAYKIEQSDETHEKIAHNVLLLRRKLFLNFWIAYIPWGPEIDPYIDPSIDTSILAESPSFDKISLSSIAKELKKILPKNTVFIRFEPPWQNTENDKLLFPKPFKKAVSDVQPPDTVIVDIDKPMEEILENMKPKWRYNARLAIKKGVIIRQAGIESIGIFHDLMKETAARDGISIHSFDYYKTLLEMSHENPAVKINLYLAFHEEDLLAGIITLFRGGEAVYLYGASSNKKRNLMAPYALQLKAMEEAKLFGCTEYDLFGIPPDNDPSHPMAGLYLFKTGFGGRIVHRPGSYDYPLCPFLYFLFRFMEKLRKFYTILKKRR